MRTFNRYFLHSKQVKISSYTNDVAHIQTVELLEVSLNGIKLKSDFTLDANNYHVTIGKRVITMKLTPVWYKKSEDKKSIIAGYRASFDDMKSFAYWCVFNQAAYKVSKEKEIKQNGLHFSIPT